MTVSIILVLVVLGAILAAVSLVVRRLYTERQARLAEKARLEQELRRTEKQLHRLTSHAFDAMLVEARRGTGSEHPWWM